jgi:hypothetical protein
MPEPDAERDPRFAIPNKRADRQYGAYMGDVESYLGKVAKGRSTRSVDPNQPALSHESEARRQANRVDKANAYERLMQKQRP